MRLLRPGSIVHETESKAGTGLLLASRPSATGLDGPGSVRKFWPALNLLTPTDPRRGRRSSATRVEDSRLKALQCVSQRIALFGRYLPKLRGHRISGGLRYSRREVVSPRFERRCLDLYALSNEVQRLLESALLVADTRSTLRAHVVLNDVDHIHDATAVHDAEPAAAVNRSMQL